MDKKQFVTQQQKLADVIGVCVVKIQKDEEGETGITLAQKDGAQGTFVKAIKTNSVVEREGILKIGDHVIWINRKDVKDMTLDEVNSVLESAPNGTSLVISRINGCAHENQKNEQLKEVQLIPNQLNSEEPYMFEVTYLA